MDYYIDWDYNTWIPVDVPANSNIKIKIEKKEGFVPTESVMDFVDPIDNADNWTAWGSPLGTVDSDTGNPPPSLKGNGSGFHNSGFVAKDSIDISNGLIVEYDTMNDSSLRRGRAGVGRESSYGTSTSPDLLIGTRSKISEGSTQPMQIRWRLANGSVESFNTSIHNKNVWRRVTLKIKPNYAGAWVYIDGDLQIHIEEELYNQANCWLVASGHDPEDWYDNFVVRKYIESEPTISVTDLGGDVYEVEVTNPNGTALSGYQIHLSNSDLGNEITSTTESLKITSTMTDYTIKGKVTLNSTIIEGAKVSCINQDTNELVGHTTSDVNGEWEFSGLNETDKYHIVASLEDGEDKFNHLSFYDIVPKEEEE